MLVLPGRGTRLKGHREALALLGNLRDRGVDARLWMPGARERGREQYVVELETEAQRGRFADALAITPPTTEIARAYAASDLVLQLSRKPEAFGRTVIEAFSVGRPVVGWAHGGVGELLAELQPLGAVPAFDEDLLLDRCQIAEFMGKRALHRRQSLHRRAHQIQRGGALLALRPAGERLAAQVAGEADPRGQHRAVIPLPPGHPVGGMFDQGGETHHGLGKISWFSA